MAYSEALASAKQRMAGAERAIRELVEGPRNADFNSIHARLLAELKGATDTYLAVVADLGNPSSTSFSK